MANLSETSEFTEGVFQLEITTPVEGGPGGVSNAQAQALTNRTLYLKNRQDDLETQIDEVSDDLSEEILDRIQAINNILPYLPKKRGYFSGLDIAGQNVGDTFVCSGYTSAVVTQDGSFTTTVRVTMPSGTFPNTNYKVEISLQSLSNGSLDQVASDIFCPVFKIISATQFDIVFRESDTGITQNLRVHMDAYTLNI